MKNKENNKKDRIYKNVSTILLYCGLIIMIIGLIELFESNYLDKFNFIPSFIILYGSIILILSIVILNKYEINLNKNEIEKIKNEK